MRLAVLAALAACNGFGAPARSVGARPLSNAGTGSSYPVNTTVSLDGSHSFDPDGGTLTFRWSVVEQPDGSTAAPADADATTTTLVVDRFGTYRLRLEVSDEDENTDASELRIVATGAITSVDAGPDGNVSWLDTVQLAGAVSIAAGQPAPTYEWQFLSRPTNSTASLTNADTLTPTFIADAAGTYVLAFDASVGDDAREDTLTIEATAVGVPVGTDVLAYTYSRQVDRILYVHDIGHAEVVKFDPTTGAQIVLNAGAFTPRSIAVDSFGGVVAVGGLGRVVTVDATNLTLIRSRAAPGCTAKAVTIASVLRVDCYPFDGSLAPISSVDMSTGAVTQVPCPVRFPDVALDTNGSEIYMVDGAFPPAFYRLDARSTPPLQEIGHGSLNGVGPPVIPAGTSDPFAVVGNGLAINRDVTLRFDLATPVSVGAFSKLRGEIAVAAGARLQVFSGDGQVRKLSAVIPSVNGNVPTPKFLAYSADEHRLIVVANTPAGDVAYVVRQ